MRLTSSLSYITAPTEMDARHPMFRSPRCLQDGEHNNQPRKIRAAPVVLVVIANFGS